jgi:hypothetical protein
MSTTLSFALKRFLRPPACSALLLALAASPALAQAPSKDVRAAAVALFDEGRALMAAGKHAEACPKLAESQQLDPGIGTLFNLSDCYERIGRTATAWLGFRDVASQALAAGQTEREKVARQRAAALEPRLSKLSVVVSAEGQAKGVKVQRDGVAVGEALWGTPVPVDPGAHAVSAEAPGRAPWEKSVRVDQPGVVTVEVPPLAEERAAPAPRAPGEAPTATPRAAPIPPRAAAPAAPAGAWRSPAGIVAMGAGAVGVGAGTALAFMAKSKFDESNDTGHCNAEGQCDSTGLALRDDAVAQGNIATAVFVAGAALAVGGAILWLSAPPSDERALTDPAPARLAVGVGPGGVALRGAF